ncbi:MAG: dual specificity protein phosphatase family protein [Alphaproteobacteria bacterium]|nr:dual specificity protein phosphatase family protein [Alphaproteobacteria bacterium]
MIRLITITFVLLISTLAVARDANWARPIILEGVTNLNQVAPNLYRSAQPTELGFKMLEQKLKIKADLNLRESQTDEAALKSTKIKTLNVPMNAAFITTASVVTALRYIKAEQEKGPVLVHCLHGADRTGVVIAMYRIIYQGWTKQQAIDELKNGGFNFHSIFFNIPNFIENADIAAIKAALAKG